MNLPPGRCLSSDGRCDFFTQNGYACSVCQASSDNYYTETENKLIKDAIFALEHRGYTIIPPTLKDLT